ncbi:MAG TPA: hypothetical protein VF271_06110 [Rhodanobacteraceae bacterium]
MYQHLAIARGRAPIIEAEATKHREVGIPCQSLINLYLRDCAAEHRKLDLSWK